MSTSPERARSARASEAPESKAKRRVGLALLLGGIGLVFGGLALPWVTFTCTAARCVPGSSSGEWVPVTIGGIVLLLPYPLLFWLFLLPYSLLFWLFLVVVALKMAGQERLPASQRSAAPALFLAGLLLAGILFPMLSISQGLQSPIEETTLAPGGFVSLFGGLLVGLGGWLRYTPGLPRRAEVPRIPAGR